MNKIQILFLIAVIIQTGITGLVLIKKDSSLANSQRLFCFEICSECFSNKPINDLHEVVNNI